MFLRDPKLKPEITIWWANTWYREVVNFVSPKDMDNGIRTYVREGIVENKRIVLKTYNHNRRFLEIFIEIFFY